ncbi:Protein of unknown function [Gryllus bimaculatus]|nr:Protein of unknown function [Gryllus bimaculatus]
MLVLPANMRLTSSKFLIFGCFLKAEPTDKVWGLWGVMAWRSWKDPYVMDRYIGRVQLVLPFTPQLSESSESQAEIEGVHQVMVTLIIDILSSGLTDDGGIVT